MSNIIGHNIEQAINIIGLQEAPPQDIILENIRLECKRGLVANNVNQLTLRNVELLSSNNQAPFSIANASNVILDNLASCRLTDKYPVIDMKMVEGAVLKDCIISSKEKGWFMRSTDCYGIEYLNNLLHDALITE